MCSAVISDAPLYEALQKYMRRAPARFHMPGHKGTASPLAGVFGAALSFDVTEAEGLDSLYDASGPILAAERRAAALFGARDTIFSASGATLCIQTMLALVSGGGGKIVCARNVHRSTVNAMALLGLEPVWVWPRFEAGESLPVTPEAVGAALRKTPDARAVFLTSPDYYGVLCDVGGVSSVCRQRGVPLLVDNSHGGHLRFCGGGELHPLRLGASLVCDSAHKTLPVLTGGAWLHIGDARISREEAKAAAALFGTTSPSYPIMLSLDLARAWLAENGEAAFAEVCERVKALDALAAQKGIGMEGSPARDPARLTLYTARAGVAGTDAARLLRAHGAEPELADARHVVLLPSPFNPPADYDALSRFLRDFPAKGRPLSGPEAPPQPERAAGLREAMLAPGETLPVEKTPGRVCAECRAPCPPGIPVVMPGERVSRGLAELLKFYGVFRLKVVK